MARFNRLKVLTTMAETGLVLVFYSPDLDVAKLVAGACVEGGCCPPRPSAPMRGKE